MEPTEPDDANWRAFDALMNMAFPPKQPETPTKPQAMTADERAISQTLAELDHMLCELRDLVAQMRASLAELRHARIKREEYKPWH